MNERIITLTDEKLKDIYTDEKLRNCVAFAYICLTSERDFKYYKALTYPTAYKVTTAQIEEAKKELERARQELKKNHYNDLIFVCMGMDYTPRYDDDVCNHRMRTEFLNAKGRRFFIEVGTGRGEEIRIDHAIDRDLQIRADKKGVQEGYNYKSLERKKSNVKYTKENVLALINTEFSCNFKNIIVSQHTATMRNYDIMCESPKESSKEA